ncbi:MAG: hypothetical protein ABL928_13820 [Sphingorhabdus sp.]
MTDSPSINDTNHTVPDDLKTVETGSSLRDAPVNDGITTPAPFARSRHPEIAEKQSKNRTQRSKTAVCYAELLHNAQSSSSTSICNRSENSRNDC